MTSTDTIQRKTTHGSFTLERTYPASPARLFRAFADPKAKAKWFAAPDGNVEEKGEFDFRVDGREVDHLHAVL